MRSREAKSTMRSREAHSPVSYLCHTARGELTDRSLTHPLQSATVKLQQEPLVAETEDPPRIGRVQQALHSTGRQWRGGQEGLYVGFLSVHPGPAMKY